MFKGSNLQYVIKSAPSDTSKALENLLNQMSDEGWDLYSMHEVEYEDGFQFNCIFVREKDETGEADDVINISTFKSRMEKMLYAQSSPYESCKEIQEKIKSKRAMIVKIKDELEGATSKNRTHLNEQMSSDLKELDALRQNLIKTISPDTMYEKIGQNKLSISLSGEVLELANPDFGAPLIAETVKIRQELTAELGYVLPKVIFEDDDKLSACEFCIKLRGSEAFNDFVYPEYLMYFEKELTLEKKQKDLIYGIDQITGENAIWVPLKKTKDFWQKGLSASEYVARALKFIAIKHVDELLDYSDVNKYMEIVGENNMFLIENIIPDFVSVAQLRYILASLVREEVSINDIIYIFEKINDFSDEASKEDLLDKVRLSLARAISKKVSDGQGTVRAFEMSDKTLKSLYEKIEEEDGLVRVDGIKVEKIAQAILKKIHKHDLTRSSVNLFVPIEIRHMIFLILSQFLNNITVLAREEILNDYEVEILDQF